jgi:hypothetical protein
VCPKVSGLAAWGRELQMYSSLPLGTVVSLFCEQSSEFYRHNPLCCFSTSVVAVVIVIVVVVVVVVVIIIIIIIIIICCLFRYQLSPETFGYSLVCFSV